MNDNINPYIISHLNVRPPSAVALGNFDGVHLGHKAIINAAHDACGTFNIAARVASVVIAWTFNGLQTGKALLTTPEYREELLHRAGIDEVVSADFNTFRDLSPEQFVRDVLVKTYNCRVAVCGFNYRFGRGGEGDADLLAELMKKYGGEAVTVAPITVKLESGDTVIVSSSLIRTALADGRPRDAAVMLGRPYSVRLPVEHGRRLGRLIGFPTINQSFPEGMIEPRRGVYVCDCKVGKTLYRGVANIGTRPTVDGENSMVTLETHLFGFSGDLYGAEVEVSLLHYLRSEVKFNGMDELRSAIERDAAAAAAYTE